MINEAIYRRPIRFVWKTVIAVFALIGAIWTFSGLLVRALPDPFMTEVARNASSPDGSKVAKVLVRRGMTVHTVRVVAGPHGALPWTVYRAQDSDFLPPIRWLDAGTLMVRLPCGRFDHLSNPDDFGSFGPRPGRLRVRFALAEHCP